MQPKDDESTTPLSSELTSPYDTSDLSKLDHGQIKQVLERLASEPLRLRSDNLVPRPWGGRKLIEFKGLEGATRPGRYGESFEVAAYPIDPEAARYPSIVEFADGSSMRLSELLGRAGETVLGSAFFQAYGSCVPLLPKFLDVEGLLSVQSHPAGNPEVYVIVDSDPGATIRVGFAREVDPAAMREMLREARAQQGALAPLFWVPEQSYAPMFAELLGKPDSVRRLGERLTPMLRNYSDRAKLLAMLETLDACYREMLGALNEIHVKPGMVVFNADPPGAMAGAMAGATSDGPRPSAQVHCLGNPESRALLLLEIRRPGITHRAWDHVRFPIRELEIDEAFEAMSYTPTTPADFIVEPQPLADRPGVLRAIDCSAFIVDHLRPQPGVAVMASTEGLPTTLHAIRGSARLFGPEEASWGTLRAGESMLLPAGLSELRVESQTPDTELVQVTIPLPPRERYDELEDQPTEAKRQNLARMRSLVTESLGPTTVLAIVNGGDGAQVRAQLEALGTVIFRSDGDAQIHTHEEPTRRGQLLGLLDALRSHRERLGGLDPDRVALGIMLPGKGTRLSPLTARLHGIKALFPMPVRAGREPVWLNAAGASLWCWNLVTWTLERQGFRGVAWKWGDELQIASGRMAKLDYDLADVDAVRFGARVELDQLEDEGVMEDLARNKEWLLVDPLSGELHGQLRRRPLAQLRERIDALSGERQLEPLIHIGSPAFSHLFLVHAEHVFGDCEGWLDVDGYLFEALTQDAGAWQAGLEHDAEQRELVRRCPDFYARVCELRRRIEVDRGHPLRIVVLDFGVEPCWGDVGQLAKAHAVWAALLAEGEVGEFARALAGIDGAARDAHANIVIGDSRVPDDGSVRDSVIIDSIIEQGRAAEAVVVRSSIGLAGLEPGAVVLDSRVDALRLEAQSMAFGSIGEYLRVPTRFVHATIVADPREEAPRLESWMADMRENPGAADNYEQVRWGNPGSFADKFAQMRQREVGQAVLEERVRVLAALRGAKT